MTLAVSKAVEEGSHAVICASTGNTSASAAAYAARAGLRCAVVVPEGRIALGKLAQALIQLVNAAEPPLRLPLGRDTLARIAEKKAFVEREIAEWRELSESTDFDEAAQKSRM